MAFEYPSEVIDLPSRGWFYPKESPLATGQIEIYYMTARHEDILTSANLIQKGVVFDKLLEALIVNKDIKIGQLLSGDKDAILLASRIMGYGKEYSVQVECPSCATKNDIDINLQDIEAKKVELDEAYKNKNEFPFHCPMSGAEVTFKLMNHQDDKIVDHEIEIVGKGQMVKKEVTTRLAHAVTSINGNTDKKFITDFIEILPARDAMQLREYIKKVNPGMDMTFDFECEKCNHQSRIEVPMTVNFFWPNVRI